MKYQAKITGNKRGVETTSPKVLLTQIKPNSTLDRDHCWVDITPEIRRLNIKGHHKPRSIAFEADLKEYLRRGTELSYTLTNIRNISIL